MTKATKGGTMHEQRSQLEQIQLGFETNAEKTLIKMLLLYLDTKNNVNALQLPSLETTDLSETVELPALPSGELDLENCGFVAYISIL